MIWNKTSAFYLFSASIIHQQYYNDHQPHFGVPGPIFSTINSSLGSLSNHDDDHNNNFKKTIGLMIKTTVMHMHHAF